MLLFTENTWGTGNGPDIQRTDLWRVDFSEPLEYLRSLPPRLFQSVGLQYSNLPQESSCDAYRIAFPATKIRTMYVIQDTVPQQFPSYVETLDTVRVDFRHSDQEGHSPVYTFLQAWRCLVRMGRVGQTTEPAFLLPSESFRPLFRFNIPVYLLNGLNSDEDFENFDADASSGVKSLNLNASYTLIDSWLSGIQQGALNKQASAQAHDITAMLQVREVLP